MSPGTVPPLIRACGRAGAVVNGQTISAVVHDLGWRAAWRAANMRRRHRRYAHEAVNRQLFQRRQAAFADCCKQSATTRHDDEDDDGGVRNGCRSVRPRDRKTRDDRGDDTHVRPTRRRRVTGKKSDGRARKKLFRIHGDQQTGDTGWAEDGPRGDDATAGGWRGRPSRSAVYTPCRPRLRGQCRLSASLGEQFFFLSLLLKLLRNIRTRRKKMFAYALRSGTLLIF